MRKDKAEENEVEYADSKITPAELAEYDLARTSALELYKTYGPIKCPAIKAGEVHFTAEGFNHLVYRMKKQERHKSVQIMRFRLLPFARTLLEKTTTIQEFEEYPRFVNVTHHGKREVKSVQIKDYGLVAIVGKYRIKVVVRQEGSGNVKFCSVIPAWSTQYYRGIKIVRNTKGNVADD